MIELTIVLIVTGLGWFLYQISISPIGYEDSDGFHYGKDEK